MRALLVVTEMALSTTLLVGASLLVRSVMHLQMTSAGFDPRGLYALDPGLPETRYPTPASKKAFYAELVSRVRAVPGVEDVALAASAPPGFNFMIGSLQVEGEPEPRAGVTSFVRFQAVSPNFFRTMRLPVVEGRAYVDSTGEPGVVMINEGFARAHWPGVPALGKRIRYLDFGGHGEWLTVIGVVADAATGGLTDDRSAPLLYTQVPGQQTPTLIIRSRGGADLLPALRTIVTSVDPHLPPPRLSNVEESMKSTAAEPRFTMALLVSFTVLALVLAAVGLYGVMSYAVAQRTREIGIRIALGATKRDVSRDVVWRGVALAGIGAAVGLTGAWWATKVVEKMLYGVTRTDPLSFAIGAAVLIATALAACLVPMHRAASVDPLIAMKAD
jgi:putative ABC transport system permease protein